MNPLPNVRLELELDFAAEARGLQRACEPEPKRGRRAVNLVRDVLNVENPFLQE